jgi:hypothetical protein
LAFAVAYEVLVESPIIQLEVVVTILPSPVSRKRGHATSKVVEAQFGISLQHPTPG